MSNTLSQPLSFSRWLSPLVDEATFDFYARRINPTWRWSRVICRVTKIEPVAADMLAFTLKPNRDRKSTRLNSSHLKLSRMPSSA